MKKLTVLQILERIHDIHGDTVSLDVTTFKASKEKARFIDCDFGEWWTQPYLVYKGHGHPRRGFLKARKTMNEKYGSEYPMQIQIFRELIQQTSQSRYGCLWPSQSDHVKETAVANNILKYGVSNPMQTLDGIHRCLKGIRNRSETKIYWKTQTKLYAVGGFEVAFLNWINHFNIEIEWQIPFQTPSGDAYFVDAHILTGVHAGKYVEIKGYMHADAAKKWEWFHAEYPISELWNMHRLQELGILKGRKPNPLYA